MEVSDFLQALIQGILLGGVYALLALGLVLVFKSTKVLNLAYGQIMMILAYIGCFFLVSHGLHLAPSVILLFIMAVLMGLALERLAMRPLIGQDIMPMIIMTLIIGVLFQGIATIVWEDKDIVLPHFIPNEAINFGDIFILQTHLWSFIVALIIFLLMFFLFRYTKVGLAMRAVAEDHQISQSMGINVKRIFAISWAISFVVAAIAGLLLGSMSVVGSQLGHIGIAKAVPVLLLGGLESVPGALLGGIIIGIAELMGAQYVGSEYREIIPFALMLLILIIKPHGLFGLRTIERI